jgi:hypothetical protein
LTTSTAEKRVVVAILVRRARPAHSPRRKHEGGKNRVWHPHPCPA